MRDMALAAIIVAGLGVSGWVAAGFADGQPLALTVTGMIALVFVLGMLEVWRWHRITVSLHGSVLAGRVTVQTGLPASWLMTLPQPLRGPVRARIEGERAPLPALQATPYLVGLLVMLGMLGTFLGMVVTLKGATLALGSTTDLDLIRAALAEPIRGLGLSFGTSVAGVATSALLGLASMLARRERASCVAVLDDFIAEHFAEFSPAAQRRKTLELLASQQAILEAERQLIESRLASLPVVAGQLSGLASTLDTSIATLTAGLEASSSAMANGLDSAMTRMSAAFETSMAQMSAGVGISMTEMSAHVHDSMGRVGVGIESAVTRLSETLQAQHQALLASSTLGWQQLDTAVRSGLQESLVEASRSIGDGLRPVIENATRNLGDDVAALRNVVLESTEARLTALVDQLSEHAGTLASTWSESATESSQAFGGALHVMLNSLAERHEKHLAAIEEQQRMREETLAERLAAVDTVQAASLQSLGGMAATLGQMMEAQGDAITALVSRSGEWLDRGLADVQERMSSLTSLVESHVGETRTLLDERIAGEAVRLEEAAAQAASGAVEVASVATVFSEAVLRFGEGTERLIARLAEIESALQRSTTRSDEQLAYYVAQAREIIDLTLLSQKQLLERLPASRGGRTEQAAGVDA